MHILSKTSFFVKQLVKQVVQAVILPMIYFFAKQKPIDENLIIFADAHSKTIPYSMKILYEQLEKQKA